MQVNLFDETGKLDIGLNQIVVKTAIETAKAEGLNKSASVDILVTDGDSIREINKSKRGIDSVTDVLSFPMLKERPGPDDAVFIGDIVLCLEKVFAQAQEYGHTLEREIGFLTAHGMLHLIGYDHDEPKGEEEMFKKQDIIMFKMGLER